MSLTARDRAVMRDMARLMEGSPLGEGKIFWDQTPQGALYWDEVYCNLLSLAKEQTEEEGPSRVEYVTTLIGQRPCLYFCNAPMDETHGCQRASLGLLLNENALETPSDILEVEYLLGWEVD